MMPLDVLGRLLGPAGALGQTWTRYVPKMGAENAACELARQIKN